ncbi:hypothetical protein ACFOLF_32550 [Paenibacillus sepulcri]|uniref:Uncharacterized protein n=1 Tax=Paenibacillus sepulcri TaxID=359917 RepID=A0ABS7CDV5_9BACL|nr:hypothetical protein [Paenibacillus sepulcri]
MMTLSRQSLVDWLQSHTGQELLIRKQEQEDLDEVRLELSDIDYRSSRSDSIDEYTSDSALLLHGRGTVITEDSEEELPSRTFEIPLQGLNYAKQENDALVLETERAKYLISVL